MTTVLLVIGAVIVALVILDRIPGVRHLISPVVGGTANGVGTLLGSATGWIAWSIKTVWKDHLTLLRHLVSSRADIDPTDPYRG